MVIYQMSNLYELEFNISMDNSDKGSIGLSDVNAKDTNQNSDRTQVTAGEEERNANNNAGGLSSSNTSQSGLLKILEDYSADSNFHGVKYVFAAATFLGR
jgi:hypothetical protein